VDGIARRAAIVPVSFGVAGIGGYGGLACDVISNHRDPLTPVSLIATSEFDRAAHGVRAAELEGRGVPVYTAFADLLRDPVDAVWLPVPIDLHRAFTEEAARAGKAVFCEKPAAGSIEDVDAMIRARDTFGVPIVVGFQDVYTDEAAAMKRAIAGGAIGRVTGATLVGCWPRDAAYYRRNAWAGRIAREGRWLLDSPAQNALAHWLHLGLFLMGSAPRASATPACVESELYRAGPAEYFDTCSLRVTMADGAALLVYLTHACGRMRGPVLAIEGTAGRLTLDLVAHTAVLSNGAGAASLPLPGRHHEQMMREFVRLLRGEPDANVGTLEMARAHTVVTNAAAQASPVRPIPRRFVEIHEGREPGHAQAKLPQIDEVFFEAAERGLMLHEMGSVPWAARAGRLDVRDYRHFAGPAASA
jgi:predicted dehydrogenase